MYKLLFKQFVWLNKLYNHESYGIWITESDHRFIEVILREREYDNVQKELLNSITTKYKNSKILME